MANETVVEETSEEKVLGPGAVLHEVDSTGALVSEKQGGIAEPAASEPVATDVQPTPTPQAEPNETQEFNE